MKGEWNETLQSQKWDLQRPQRFCRDHLVCTAWSPSSMGWLHRTLNFDTFDTLENNCKAAAESQRGAANMGIWASSCQSLSALPQLVSHPSCHFSRQHYHISINWLLWWHFWDLFHSDNHLGSYRGTTQVRRTVIYTHTYIYILKNMGWGMYDAHISASLSQDLIW